MQRLLLSFSVVFTASDTASVEEIKEAKENIPRILTDSCKLIAAKAPANLHITYSETTDVTDAIKGLIETTETNA